MKHVLKEYIRVIFEKGGHPLTEKELESVYASFEHNPIMKLLAEMHPPEVASMSPEEIRADIRKALQQTPELEQRLITLFQDMRYSLKSSGSIEGASANRRMAVNTGERAEAAAEGWLKRLGKEKWVGKKGLAVAGATVALGAVAYGTKKYFDHKRDNVQHYTWTGRVSTPPAQITIAS